MIIPVILAGGTGSRLWPLSRQLNPKQFMAVTDSVPASDPDLSAVQTLFQQTLQRLAGLEKLAPPVVICNEDHRFLVAEQLRQLSINNAVILLEPVGRNTAPAVTLAAEVIGQMVSAGDLPADEKLMMLVLPADHVIRAPEIFHDCVRSGVQQASSGKLVTFGITPQYAETGYGYIQRGEPIKDEASGKTPGIAFPGNAFKVQRFVEKPDSARAQQYLEEGGYYWNSGMFLFELDSWLAQIQQHAPVIAACCHKACAGKLSDGDFTRIDASVFETCPSDSIDYAVMEKTAHAVVVPMDASWNDLGAWNSLWDISDKKTVDNNVLSGDTHVINVKDSYIRADSRLVVAIGMQDAVIVETADAVLVASRQQVQDVKKAVIWLEQQNRSEASSHTLVYRPWGSYESLATGPGFQVKRIRVRPGASLSLQMHHKRAEHWVVIHGLATVTCGDRVFDLKTNESTFIPLGSKHRLQNNTSEWVELIEVQTGSYLGEDDIVRFDDVYGRVPAG